MKKHRVAVAILLALTVSGCSSFRFSPFPKFGGKIEGVAWCSKRYLDMVNEYQKAPKDIDSEYGKKLRLSKDGYIYALAATLTLEKDNSEKQYNFGPIKNLTKIPSLSVDKLNGFQAETFTFPDPRGKKQLIIAFRGSDQFLIDYLGQNFGFWQIQNSSAREYVLNAMHYRDTHKDEFSDKVVVTGNSLGGALAAHVTNTKYTEKFITEAWLFNPSPRPGVSPPQGGNPKIRLLSTRSEILNISSRSQIGVQERNKYTDFDLIESSSFYNHYRWVLAREILWYADLAQYFDQKKHPSFIATEPTPLQIIASQNITDANCSLTDDETKARRTAYEQKNKNTSAASGTISLKEITNVDKAVETD
ncbi:Protein of unknown function [Pseudomonas sp. NFACC23-1]|nr:MULTISPECIES: Mbeg1-like protein [unclassified Pseudomonas]SDB53834.1 Protein of unknown function [Pseudomonas sp. NFACC17-2]SEJ74382.1 Protein of unknown function [Pseudomonas sp. NFACC23-1]SFW86263.1 Protein of unknown function [Pseudomonas sp. NFACC16-2]